MITFLQEDRVCVIKFLPESPGFSTEKHIYNQKSTFTEVKRDYDQKSTLLNSIILKSMWSLISHNNRKTIDNNIT